ncbi:LytR family transcriptional regulator [Alkalihalobacillus sp. AL-G]|nr:LytR family transcriptional regulator [Alkalihalobacillus sp. AL-G]
MFKMIILFFCLILIGTAGYAFYLYDSVKETAGEMHEPLSDPSEKPSIKGSGKGPISILLMGVDERPGDRGRSDTMIVITVNPNEDSMYMFNIPRDTRTEIIGKNKQDKINHAYAFGGTEMAVKTVENFLDIPIHYYIKVNMESFKDIVNAVGGVNVNNKFAFNQNGFNFNKGELHLNGDKALAYSRMRKRDPKGDLGRNARQQQVIKAVINEGAKVSSITKFDNVLDVLSENVRTNMTFKEMKSIQANYKNARKDINSFEVQGQGQRINSIYYYIVSEQERNKLSNKLKEHLEIS